MRHVLIGLLLCAHNTALAAPGTDDTVQKIEQRLQERRALEGRRADATADERAAIAEELAVVDRQIHELATGTAPERLDPQEADIELEAEVRELVRPLLLALKKATQSAREVEELRWRIERNQELIRRTDRARDELSANLSAAGLSDDGHDTLAGLQRELTRRRQDLDTQQRSDQRALDIINQESADLAATLDHANESVRDFFSERAQHLAYGGLVFGLVHLGMRLLKRQLVRLAGAALRQRFLGRLASLGFDALTVIAPIMAMLLVFNQLNDWLLVGLTLLGVGAAGWVLLSSLPQLIEQLGLLLNLGAVQEGERVVFLGAPWKVERLDFYTELVNPTLRGGAVTLPVSALSGLYSRPMDADEVWFPTEEGDWVTLDSEVFGQVILQSPELVQVQEEGGAIVSFTLEAFLEQSPRNLSHGFRANVVFGIDHAHLDAAVDEIPAALIAALREGFEALVGADAIRDVNVEMVGASPNALEFDLDVDLEGSVAEHYMDLCEALPRIAARSCLRNGWRLAAPQVVLRQGR